MKRAAATITVFILAAVVFEVGVLAAINQFFDIDSSF